MNSRLASEKGATMRWLLAVTSSALCAGTFCLALEPPAPVTSEYFKSSGGGFTAAPGGGVRYYIDLNCLQELAEPLYISARFPNPENAKKLVEFRTVMKAGQKKLVLQSPPFPRVKRDTLYTVVVLAFKDEARTERVAVHEQGLVFNMSDGMAHLFGIQIAP